MNYQEMHPKKPQGKTAEQVKIERMQESIDTLQLLISKITYYLLSFGPEDKDVRDAVLTIIRSSNYLEH